LRQLSQARFIHLSDVHFGAKHICAPEDPSGSRSGIPDLEELIEQDLSNADWADALWATPRDQRSKTPLFLTVTGDVAQNAAPEEFRRASEFLDFLTRRPLLDSVIGRKGLFLVPGNHDVLFKERAFETRFQPYATLYNKVFEGARDPIQPHNATSLNQVHARPEAHVLLAEVNSCLYVEEDTEDESRGQVDLAAIRSLRTQLEGLAATTGGFIKIALVHHHPVLIPAFVEAGRGYDAVLNGGSLLRLLREHGFQLVLHGHKHNPQVFSFDPESAWAAAEQSPQLVVAGGSCGSSELPPGGRSANTYNVITVKWDPKARHGRVQIITRGLKRLADDAPLDPDLWQWTTLRVFDRAIGPYRALPVPEEPQRIAKPQRSDSDQRLRHEHYQALRFNFPVAEIQPSLMPGQAYEVRVWLEQHSKDHRELPIRVTWSAGTMFERKVCGQHSAPAFCSYFHYWGPTLVQAQLDFTDGTTAYGYVYARFPGPA